MSVLGEGVKQDEDKESLEIDGTCREDQPLLTSYNLGFAHYFLTKPSHFLLFAHISSPEKLIPSGQSQNLSSASPSPSPFPPQEASENLAPESGLIHDSQLPSGQEGAEVIPSGASTGDAISLGGWEHGLLRPMVRVGVWTLSRCQ